MIGHKNFLFASTPGAQASAIISNLIETAKETGLDLYRYLVWVLERAPRLSMENENWVEKLIPASAPDVCRVP